MTLNRFLLVTHRWIGLGTALFLLLLGGTGAVLVYAGPIERALAPRLFHVEPTATRLPLDTIVAIARRAHPKGAPNGVTLSERDDIATRVYFGYRLVFVDPYRGTVKGERGIGQSVTGGIRALHTNLLTGDRGRFFLILASFNCVFLTLGGVVLWWPRKILWITRNRSFKGINFDLHNAVGLISSLGIFVLAGTIVLRTLDPMLDPWYRRTFGTSAPVRLAPRAAPTGAPVSLDSIVLAAEGAVSGRVAEVIFAKSAGGVVRVNKWQPGGRGARARNIVFVDPNDGRVLGVIEHRSLALGTSMADLIEDWHTAAIYGTPSKVIGFLACVLLVFETVTGPLIWLLPFWRRRSKRVRIAS